VPRPLHGSVTVGRGTLGFFGPSSGFTLVSHPVNGLPGVLAFRDRQLAAVIAFKVRDDRIYDIHGVADPRKFGQP
jgi:hypothetical protein